MTGRRPSHDQAVAECYSRASEQATAGLCCPSGYDARHLEAIPAEILERDYGCGDPSRHLRRGETVLDLGSGSGKICFIASQVVGTEGRVIGVDANDDMLALAEAHREGFGNRIGYHNVEFRKGRIQDLALDLRRVDERLSGRPARTPEEIGRLERWKAKQRRTRPMIETGSIDVVVSNCVLNLVRTEDKLELFREMQRVLKPGGRAVISDIVSDREIPGDLLNDPDLWAGCVSGAFEEELFVTAFEDAGFDAIRILARDREPWQVHRGVEFRSMTVEAVRMGQKPRTAEPAETDCCSTSASSVKPGP